MTSSARLVDQVVDYAIIALSPEGLIESWNAGAERLKGYTRDEAMGENFSMFYTPADQRAGVPQQFLSEARANGSFGHSGWRVRQDGTRFWGDVVITALYDDTDVLTGYVKVTRDLTEQHDTAEALRTADERLRILIDTVSDYSIIALSPDGIIESWNNGAVRLTGYTRAEAIGQNFSMFYPDEDVGAGLPQQFLEQARAEGSCEHTGWRVRKDGSHFWGDVIITALYDVARVLTGYVKVTRDLTGGKQLETAQDTFYSAFEHDFRIPLTAIKGFTELVRDAGPLDRNHFLERIDRNADRLLSMIEELVDYARLRSGRIPISLRVIDLGFLAEQAVENLASPTDGARITVSITQTRVLGDPRALDRVITNVLANAVKYSDAGSPISIATESKDGHGILRVTDHGRGIDERDLDAIFVAFERGRLAQNDTGTGLGLASARQLIRLQGGTITIASTVDVGTTVTLFMPLASG